MKWALRIILALGATGLCLARAPMSDAQAAKRMKDAQTFAERGQLRQAAASIETILRSRPNDIDALAMLCAVRTADGDAVELEPVDQGLVHKRFREAADACKRAAAVDPESPVFARAWAHDVVRAEIEAERVPAFRAWTRVEPGNAKAVGGLTAWLEMEGRIDEVDSMIERAAATSPAFGQRVRFEYVCRAAGIRTARDLRPVLDTMLSAEATDAGRAMLGVLRTQMDGRGREALLEFLDLVDRDVISAADADNLFGCLTSETFFTWSTRVCKPGPGDTFPEKRTWPVIAYPEDALRARRQGKAFLLARVNDDGTMGPIWVARTTGPSFADAAVGHARDRRYWPGTHDGKAVPFPLLLRVDFKLRR